MPICLNSSIDAGAVDNDVDAAEYIIAAYDNFLTKLGALHGARIADEIGLLC